ncbi:OmpA family protein, partial [Vibrio sp. 506]|uniref:OmpA family protein n=1 Tax=Vibrio sp. 506 TaxID=3074607 RepID=UPI002964246B
EPYELRGSRTVLREAIGEVPVAYSPNCADTPKGVVVDSEGCANWVNDSQTHLISFFFAMDEHQVTPSHDMPLSELKALLQSNPNAQVILIGDTSPEASLEYNKALAKKRTAAIRKLLVRNGIQDNRIEEQEFYQNTALTVQLKKRERRTIAVVNTKAESTEQAWTIFSSDSELTPNSKLELNYEN